MDLDTINRHVAALDTAAELLDLLATDLDHEARTETDETTALELRIASERAQQGWAHATGAARALRDLRPRIVA